MPVIALGVVAALLLLLANGAFVALEQASASGAANGADGPGSDDASRRDGRQRTRTAAQLGITLCALALGVLAQPILAEPLERAIGSGSDLVHVVTVVAALAVVIAAQLVLGELVPRSVGAAHPDRTIATLRGPFRAVSFLLAPLTAACAVTTRGLARALGVGRPRSADPHSRADLRHEVAESARQGAIGATDAELFERTMRLAEKTAADALTPRVQVVSIPVEGDAEDLVELSVQTGLSRVPVVKGDLDHVVGMAHVKDVLALPVGERRGHPVAALKRPVLAVPEHRSLTDLMVQLRTEPGQAAVVVDEYGGTAGLITLEDVMEELVGPINDEHDAPATGSTVRRWGGAHLVDGGLRRDDLLEACGFEMPRGPYDTLGGFIMTVVGRVPEVGDRVVHDGWVLRVLEMDRHRVASVRVEAPAPRAVEVRRP